MNILVIGGGDTGSDCVGTSIRQGAKSVRQIELLSQPRFFQAVSSAAIGYVVMSFLMTATPIEMNIIKNMSLNLTGF